MSEGASVVGFVGLGNMGIPMAARLHAVGLRVVGFDVSDAANDKARAQGLETGGLGEVGGAATLLICMLPSSDVVEEVLGAPELRGALRPGTLVIDMSSSEPLRTRALAQKLADDGIELIDAPVSGGVRGAEAGTLTIMIGGEASAAERARPVLQHMGRVVLAGPVGAGHAIKALNNLLSATHLWATSEAMLAGQRFGLDPEVMLSIFNTSSGRSGSTEVKWPSYIVPRTFNSGFALGLMLKDMRIAAALIEVTGVPGPLGAEAVELWARAAADLPVDADHTEVARWLEEQSRTAP